LKREKITIYQTTKKFKFLPKKDLSYPDTMYLLSGWPTEEALHPDIRRMEGEPGQDPRNQKMGRLFQNYDNCVDFTGKKL
jgi:hypothetical protein